jgi:hypothetical protein
MDLAFISYSNAWLLQEISAGGEFGDISRNDGLLKLVIHLGGLSDFTRNLSSSTIATQTRPDALILYYGTPVLYCEEKENSIEEATQDLLTKFIWLPHFENLPFVFGVAISKQELKLFCMTNQDNWVQNPVYTCLLNSLQRRLDCLHMFIKVAKVLKYFIVNDLIKKSNIIYSN